MLKRASAGRPRNSRDGRRTRRNRRLTRRARARNSRNSRRRPRWPNAFASIGCSLRSAPSFCSLLLLTLLTGAAYPLLVTLIAKAAFPRQAEGSILVRDGRAVGSATRR